MKKTLLVSLVFLGFRAAADPCGPPPPLGLNPIFAFDYDNDGAAVFDIGYYIEHMLRPNLEQWYGVSSAGYDFIFYGPDGPISPAPMYTNIEPEEIRDINFEYSGSGPTFQALPPCFYPVVPFDTIKMYAVAPGADFDNDGITNADEDSNHNGNLMDDDSDGDGLINIEDTTNSLGILAAERISLQVYPNPVRDNTLAFESSAVIASVIVYDSLGRQITVLKNDGNSVNLNGLQSGIYLMRFESDRNSEVRKIVIDRSQ